jgi:molybdate transport system regulatory protein
MNMKQRYWYLTWRYVVGNIKHSEIIQMPKKKDHESFVPEFGIKHGVRSGHKPELGIVLRSKVWLEKDGKLFMGWGRATLLERIDRLGSISAAARSMKLAYRNAWLWVEAMNRLAGTPLVTKTTGGPKGGHARLTDEGRRIVKEYLEKRAIIRDIIKQ